VIRYLPAILALLAAAAGWHYMFYSSAARKLQGIEDPDTNRLRIRLRRVCGLAMILMAGTFYAGTVALMRERFVEAAWWTLGMLVFMCAMVALGLVDLRLTNRLRRSRGRCSPHRKDPMDTE
jgi:hypothetical protein